MEGEGQGTEPNLVMGKGKQARRQTRRIVRTPATRLGHLQKRLGQRRLGLQAVVPPAGGQPAGQAGRLTKHK